MTRRSLVRAVLTVALLAAAAGLVWRGWIGRAAPGEKAFFYDLSARKLFTAPRTAVPPIRGIDGPEEDGVRATVISPTGHPRDRATWKVVYLEKYSPELKRQMEAAQASGEALGMGRIAALEHRWVRRPEDSEWLPLSSPQAEAILNSWAAPGPDGATPVLCAP